MKAPPTMLEMEVMERSRAKETPGAGPGREIPRMGSLGAPGKAEKGQQKGWMEPKRAEKVPGRAQEGPNMAGRWPEKVQKTPWPAEKGLDRGWRGLFVEGSQGVALEGLSTADTAGHLREGVDIAKGKAYEPLRAFFGPR